jgi:hypothetical protein
VSPIYLSWQSAKGRCHNPADKRFPHYGGRGIRMCDRWLNSFENFLADMGERPTGMSLDRIDVNGDYAPDNCRWATAKEQADNRRRTVWVDYEGSRVTLKDFAKARGIKYRTLWARMRRTGLSAIESAAR